LSAHPREFRDCPFKSDPNHLAEASDPAALMDSNPNCGPTGANPGGFRPNNSNGSYLRNDEGFRNDRHSSLSLGQIKAQENGAEPTGGHFLRLRNQWLA